MGLKAHNLLPPLNIPIARDLKFYGELRHHPSLSYFGFLIFRALHFCAASTEYRVPSDASGKMYSNYPRNLVGSAKHLTCLKVAIVLWIDKTPLFAKIKSSSCIFHAMIFHELL